MDAKAAHSHGFIKFLAWFELNKKRVLTGALIVLVVGLVVGLGIYYQSQKEVRASEALSNVRTPVVPTAAPLPGTAEAYQKVAQEHKGTQAAGRALMLAGTTFYVQGQYAEAQKMFEQFSREYPGSPFVPEALYGVASCLEAEKKPTDAIAKYEELRKRYAKSSTMDQTKLSLGRLYEDQGKPAQALELYDELVKGNQMSGIASEAGLRMEDLLAAHPELKKTNAPPLMTPQISMQNTNIMIRPSTNILRSTNLQRPAIMITNRAASTGGPSPLKLNISTNK